MNNFQNFGDLNDNVIRSRLREMLMHRATVDRKDYALFDEEIDKDIAKDIEPDEERNAFEAHQTMGTGLKGECGKPIHMCSCDQGGKGRKMMKNKMIKNAMKKNQSEAVQEVINAKTIRKNLKPMGKKVKKGITEYNDLPNRDVDKSLKARVKKARANKRFEEKKKEYFKDLYGVDEEVDEPYKPSEGDTEWIGSGKKKSMKKAIPQGLKEYQEKLRAYREKHGCSQKEAQNALKKK